MSDFLQLVFSGLAQGAVYGLVALGFVAIFSVREIVNLVQGEYAALAGLTAFKERECPSLNLAFWTWHDRVEDQHAAHTADELAEAFTQPWFDEDRFLAGATRMLDGVQAFWDGLWADREAGVER